MLTPEAGWGDSHMKQTGMLVVSLRGVNFWILVSLRVFRAKRQYFMYACIGYDDHVFISWMNEWMCIYIPHISHIVSRQFTILIEWDRTPACKGVSGCRYRFIFDLIRPPNPCMNCTIKLQIYHHPGNYVPYSFRQGCGFFNVPCLPYNSEDAGDRAYGL